MSAPSAVPLWATIVTSASAGAILGAIAKGMADWLTETRRFKREDERRLEQRRVEVYVELLLSVARDWIPAMATTSTVVGDRPREATIDERFLLTARINAFGSSEVRKLYQDLRNAVGLVVSTHASIIRLNSQALQAHSTNANVEHEGAGSPAWRELVAQHEARWKAAQMIREDLERQVRLEMGHQD